jgi:protein SCO1/2
MKRKIWVYVAFFAALLAMFYFLLFRDYDFSKSNLPVINDNVQDFAFTDQNGKKITQANVEDKVHVVEYFFTTCRGICPKMNANMRRVYDVFKDEPGFLILSHTCMPEVDTLPLLKKYEQRMLSGTVVANADGSYRLDEDSNAVKKGGLNATNWFFVTGDKGPLYKMARQSYMIDNNKPDSTQLIKDQFIHTQFFALVDKQRRLRGIYDGLKNDEIEKLKNDIKGLLKEKITSKRFMNGFSNNPG